MAPGIEKQALVEGQHALARRVSLEDSFDVARTFCGCDVKYSGDGSGARLAFVTLDADFNVLERRVFDCRVDFPYIPTFFAYREGPLVVSHFPTLETRPDVLFVDGHGIAHPRRAGLACHVGVLLGVATIGVAKQNLRGVMARVPIEAGEFEPMFLDGMLVGHVVKNVEGMNPVYISPGHGISVEKALEVSLSMMRRHKLPEPLRLAHEAAIS